MNVNALKILFVHCPARVVFWAYIEPGTWGINKHIFWPLILPPKSHSTSGVAFGQVPDVQVFAWPAVHCGDQPNFYCFTISSWFTDIASIQILLGLTFCVSPLINFLFFFSQSWWSSFQTSVTVLFTLLFVLIHWYCAFFASVLLRPFKRCRETLVFKMCSFGIWYASDSCIFI